MTTREFEAECAKLGLTPRALRYWRTIGLIPHAILESKGRHGVRGYHPRGSLDRVREIRRMQGEGLSISEIRLAIEAAVQPSSPHDLRAPVAGEFCPPEKA